MTHITKCTMLYIEVIMLKLIEKQEYDIIDELDEFHEYEKEELVIPVCSSINEQMDVLKDTISRISYYVNDIERHLE